MAKHALFKTFLAQIIEGEQAFKLALVDADQNQIGALKPVTKQDVNDEQIITLLTDWRRQNSDRFYGQFEPTVDRTRNWLSNVMLARHDQLLMMVHCEGQPVGHIAFKDLTSQSAFLDNVILGVRCNVPKIMQVAATTLIDWLFDKGELNEVYGSVFTDNVPALMFNKQLGFEIEGKYPMIKSQQDQETRWAMGGRDAPSVDNKYCYQLIIRKDSWDRTV